MTTKKKIILVGDGMTGKTSIVYQLIHNKTYFGYVPTLFDNYLHKIKEKGQDVELDIRDTAGQEDFDRLRPLAYSGTDIALIVFSVINPIRECVKKDKLRCIYHYY